MRLFVMLVSCLASLMTLSAQSYTPMTLLSAITLTNQTAYAPTAVIQCGEQSAVAVQISYGIKSGGAAAKHTNYVYFTRSNDGTNWDSMLEGIAIANTIASIGNPIIVTNIPTYGAGFMKVLYTTNHGNAGTDLTNYAIQYATKVGAW